MPRGITLYVYRYTLKRPYGLFQMDVRTYEGIVRFVECRSSTRAELYWKLHVRVLFYLDVYRYTRCSYSFSSLRIFKSRLRVAISQLLIARYITKRKFLCEIIRFGAYATKLYTVRAIVALARCESVWHIYGYTLSVRRKKEARRAKT